MKIIIGLGNPGEQYANTRHNAGIMLVDRISQVVSDQLSVNSYGWRRKKDITVAEFPQVILVKTGGVFMNESGRMVLQAVGNKQQGIESLYIAHDDLDIKLGEYKIQFAKGPKDHHGVQSVETALKTDQFWRIRIGINNRNNTESIPGDQYVLQRFSNEERGIINQVIEEIVGKVN